MTKQPDLNARAALDNLKLELANELNIHLSDVGTIGGTMTRKLVEMGENQLIDNDDPDTFNPS